MKLDYGKTFTLGLGFFVITLTWSVYNSFVPIFVGDLLAGASYRTFLVGLVMTMDNIAAVTLQPYFGALSDRTWTRIGRRMPFLAIGAPVAAASCALVPVARHSLAGILSVLIVMNLAMAAFRAPTVALMPDITPSPLRSQANGVINFMGGVGGIVAFFVLSQLYRVDPGLPFYLGAALMVVALAVLFRVIREPRPEPAGAGGAAERSDGIVAAIRQIWTDPDRSALRLLLAIFAWFMGWSGVEALFTLYAVDRWGMDPSRAAFVLGFFAVTFVVFAIPSGLVATAIGRRRTIFVGLAGIGLALAGLAIAGPGTWIIVGLAVAGAFWALVNINSYPMVVDMAAGDRVGAYTGLYYFFSTLAAIAAPPLFGWLMDVAGQGVMFPVAVLWIAVSVVLMLGVRRGEAPQPVAQARQSKAAA